jgi:hypothetical protein
MIHTHDVYDHEEECIFYFDLVLVSNDQYAVEVRECVRPYACREVLFCIAATV